MKWQEKVKKYQEDRRVSGRKLAERVGISNTALRAALDAGHAWDTVQTAIRLAKELGVSVEFLFDPETQWPPPPSLQPASPEQISTAAAAISALERMGQADLLAQLAAGLPPESLTATGREPQKRNRPRK